MTTKPFHVRFYDSYSTELPAEQYFFYVDKVVCDLEGRSLLFLNGTEEKHRSEPKYEGGLWDSHFFHCVRRVLDISTGWESKDGVTYQRVK